MQDLKKLRPLPKMYKTGPVTVEAPGYQKVDGETIPRRNVKCVQELRKSPHKDITTIHDILTYASANYGNAQCVGWRDLVKVHTETKKIKKVVNGETVEVDKDWTYFELSGYHYYTFTEFEKLAHNIGAGLRKLGMNPTDKLHIFAATHAYWFAMAHGALSQSLAIVTAYDTLGESGLTHSLKQTNSSAIFLDTNLLTKLINPLKTATDIKLVIYGDNNEVKQADIEKLKEAHPHVTIMSITELIELGKANPIPTTPPKPEDLCCVMYTSGSTGTPKGVLLKHSNVVAAIAGVDVCVGDYIGPSDSLLTYLPLAHILEFVFENAVLFWGGTMGYGSARTLSDTSMRKCKGDIRELKPTVLVGVPAVWELVKKGIVSKVNQSSPIVKNMFWGALAAKNFLLANGLPGSNILDAVVFNKVKDATGGRLRICMNGGGPIAKETQRFISMVITPMISGYGLTETSAMGILQDPLAWTDEALGEIPGSIEMKLVDFPDAGYFSTNKPPQGEVWIRGHAVSSGYLGLEEETKEAYTADGWFKTGDIGQFDSKGNLKIIDRKKNLVKTLNGEYIALEKLEAIYRSCAVVGNICVYADPNKSKPVAIIVPAEPALKKLAKENDIKGEQLEELVQNKKINEIVLKQLQATGKKSDLAGFEIIEGVVLVEEEWTAQNGLTTSASKLNRKGIMEKYRKDIDRAYKS